MFREHLSRRARRGPVRPRTLAVLVFVLALLLAACGGTGADEAGGGVTASSSDADGAGLTIVATTTILGDITGEIVGDADDVAVLMQAGVDPHNFEPSAQQLVQMHEADLVVTNGANLEEHLQDPLAEVENEGVPVFHAAEHVETLAFGADEDEHAEDDPGDTEDEHAEEDEHAHEEGSTDPHFWTDPTRTAAAVRALGEQIGELSGDLEGIRQRAEAYAERLEELDRQISDTLADIPHAERTLVTNHEAFNYFADRYGFTIVGTVIPSLSTGAEPSAQDLEQLARTIEQEQVTAIFTENIQPEQLAQTLAQEVGTDVEVIELYSDSLGDEGSDAATYVDLMQANASLIGEALSA